MKDFKRDNRFWWVNNPVTKWIIRVFLLIVLVSAILKYFNIIN
ncbi:hypothetical protein [Lacinutrix sp. Hel_I_90]|nr:hypothetical protein [Lacinutrix sp. Hel_I_90]